jgi:hypothetical protein
MLFVETTTLLTILLALSHALIVHLFLKTRALKTKVVSVNVKRSLLSNGVKHPETIKKHRILDPHESKLLQAIIDSPYTSGLCLRQTNKILNLTKLTNDNQRQRRHIILKELNLKLYLISGERETIMRRSSDTDKRIKFYGFKPELTNIELIKILALGYT